MGFVFISITTVRRDGSITLRHLIYMSNDFQDIDDLQNFGLVHGVDYIAASFVRRGEDIDTIRHVLGEEGAHIKVMAKILVFSVQHRTSCVVLEITPLEVFWFGTS